MTKFNKLLILSSALLLSSVSAFANPPQPAPVNSPCEMAADGRAAPQRPDPQAAPIVDPAHAGGATAPCVPSAGHTCP